jgi:hypothetical protein
VKVTLTAFYHTQPSNELRKTVEAALTSSTPETPLEIAFGFHRATKKYN